MSSIVIDRELLKAVEEVFKHLGMALMELQVFTKEHPRFCGTADRLSEHLVQYFEKMPGSGRLTFTLRRDQVEYRRIPLVNLGQHGARFVEALKTFDAAGIQLNEGLSGSGMQGLIEGVVERRRLAKEDPESLAALPPDDRFRFFSSQELKDLRLAAAVGDLQDHAPADDLQDVRTPEFRVSKQSFANLMGTYQSALTHVREGRSFDLDTLKSATDQAVSLLWETRSVILETSSKTYFDDFTFHHSMNVCLLSSMLAARLLEDREQVQRIANAALLHDIGKSRIPADIINKRGPLTAGERERLERHPIDGAEILLCTKDIDPLAVRVAFGHHMHDALGSYPKTKRPFELDWVVQMVGVVDVYEALTAVRPYKKAMSSERAFHIMMQMPGLQHRIGFVKLLYDCLGPYAPGTVLELDSGAWAVVVAPNPVSPYLPRIRVITDEQRNPLAEPPEFELSDPVLPEGFAKLKIVRPVVFKDPTDDVTQVEQDTTEPDNILGAPLYDCRALMQREG